MNFSRIWSAIMSLSEPEIKVECSINQCQLLNPYPWDEANSSPISVQSEGIQTPDVEHEVKDKDDSPNTMMVNDAGEEEESNSLNGDSEVEDCDNDEHQNGKTHVCKVCNKVLSSVASYSVHMKMHSTKKPYKCTSCNVSFCHKPYLEAHMRTHTGERPFKCTVCKKCFTQKSSLNTHKRKHTGEKPYACDFCDKRFSVKSYVTAHHWTHITEKQLNCSKCNLQFNSKHQYAIHIRSHSISERFDCIVCGRTFSKNAYLIRHKNKH